MPFVKRKSQPKYFLTISMFFCILYSNASPLENWGHMGLRQNFINRTHKRILCHWYYDDQAEHSRRDLLLFMSYPRLYNITSDNQT
jgi:hypothetical protein